MASLSTLVVDLQVESAKLRSGLDQANKHLGGFGAQAKRIGNLIAGAFAADITKDAIVGLANFVRGGAQVADEMGEMAASIGVPVEAFSQLAHAASFSSLSTEQLGSGMSKLAKLMGEAASGGRDQAALFDALGVSVTDTSGAMRGTDEVMKDLAERFAGMGSSTAKAALAQKLFGESGVKMLPLLDQGRDGLAAFAAEADRFGVTVTEQGSASAAVFNDSLDRLRKMAEGLAIRVAQDLAPSVANLSTELLGSATKSNALNDAAKGLAATMRGLVSVGAVIAEVFRTAGVALGRTASAAVSMAKGDFATAASLTAGIQADVVVGAARIVEQLQAIWSTDTVAAKALDEQGKAAEKSADAIVRAIQKQKELSDLRTKAANEATAALRKMQAEAERVTASVQTPMETFRAELKALNEMVEKGAIAWDTYNRARAAATEKLNSAIGLPETTDRKGDTGKSGFGTLLPEATDRDVPFASKMPEQKTGFSGDYLKDKAYGFFSGLAGVERMFIETAEQMVGDIVKGMKQAAMTFVSKLGDVGQVVNSALQGLESGGIFGAIIAVIMELFAMFEGFQGLIDIGNGSLKSHAEVLGVAFGALADALSPLLGALSFLIDTVLGFLAPIIENVAGVFESIAPLLYLLGFMLQGLQPIFDMLGRVLEGVIWVLDKVIWGVFQVLKGVGIAILSIVKGVGDAWNGIVSAIQWVFRQIGSIELFGEPIFGFLNDWANGMDSAKFNMDGVNGAMDTLIGLTWEGAKAASAENAERLKATENLEKFNEALTNVPSGLKVNALRFNASDPVGGAALAGGGGLVGQLGGTVTNTYVFHIDSKAKNGAELGEEMMRYLKKKKFARTGTPHGPLGG